MNLIEQIKVNDVSIDGYQGTYYSESPEWVKVILDSEDKVLAGIKEDGTVEWSAGVPTPIREHIEQTVTELHIENKVDKEYGKSLIDSSVAESFSSIDSPEYLQVTTDIEDKVVMGIKPNGAVYIPILENDSIDQKVDDAIERIDASVNEKMSEIGAVADYFSEIEDIEGRSEITTDSEDKIISYRDADGVNHENVGIQSNRVTTNSLNLTVDGMTEFQQALKDSGFNPGGTGDWTDSKNIAIPIPNCAIINITSKDGVAIWPTSKTVDYEYYIEFWDMQGNFFKKEIIFNAQGSSSLGFVKKNGSIDICNNNGWDDEDTFKIRFGDWVSQDSFHLKAYYTNYTRGEAVVCYQLSDDVYKTRGFLKDRPWKPGLIDFSKILPVTPAGMTENGISDTSLQIDNGARCMPDGFPCIVYLNGDFYGIYSWQLKKHRDNYHMNKKKVKHIHLDGIMDGTTLFNDNIDWTAFEVRNPKNLVYSTAHEGTYKYDGDIPGQFEIAGNSDGSKIYDTWVVGSYAVDKIVEHNGHLYINTIVDNTAEPIYHSKNNADDAPDFKNKTGCGWINVTNTVKVKESIIKLSKRIPEINNSEYKTVVTNNGNINIGSYKGIYDINKTFGKGEWVINDENYFMSIRSSNVGNQLSDDNYWVDITTNISSIRQLFNTYFDSDNVIDYQLINMAIMDGDAFRKNWQWITYDGIKWWVCQYDKDSAFGNPFNGYYTEKPSDGGWMQSSEIYPTGVAIHYYLEEHKSRWNELVEKGIFTRDYIFQKIVNWVLRVGQENYEKEWKKWPNSPCNRDCNIDFDYWMFTGEQQLFTKPQNVWDSETEYIKDDLVWYPVPGGDRWFQFKAIANNINKQCVKDGDYFMGYRDSIWRIYKFLDENLKNQNNFINSI